MNEYIIVESIGVKEMAKNTLGDRELAKRIHSYIIKKKFQPGTRLPPEREMATLFHVSRPKLRESLKMLEEQGFVEMRPQSGSYVKELSFGTVSDSLSRYFQFSDVSFINLLELREELEPGAAAIVARRGSEAQISRLQSLAKEIMDAFCQQDIQTYLAKDLEFHKVLCEATDNPLFVAILNALHEIRKEWLMETIQHNWLEEGAVSHLAICEAIRNHDTESAREAMRWHMRVGRKVIKHLN